MKAYCLASSSAGNCYILEFDINGSPTRLMVECGLPLKEIYKRMIQFQINASEIHQCLITHAHGDHCKAAHDLVKRGIQVFATKPTLSLLKLQGEELVDLVPKKVCDGVYAMTFAVEHDIEGACGFVIKTAEECVIFVNDHKRWTCDLSNFKPDYVFIECNYDHKMVYAQLHEIEKEIKMGNPDPNLRLKAAQHTRNLNAHCSLHGTLAGLKKLNLEKCKTIFLMHLSDRHANEYRMKNEVAAQTKVMTYVCKRDGGIK